MKQPFLERDQHIVACGPGTSFSGEERPHPFFSPVETLVRAA